MNFHGITLQTPLVCTAVTLSGAVGKRRSVFYQGVTIEFSTILDRLFRGFENREGFQMVTPEKAILDTLHLHKRLPVTRVPGFGCGEREVLHFLRKNKGAMCTGIEINEDRVVICIAKDQTKNSIPLNPPRRKPLGGP